MKRIGDCSAFGEVFLLKDHTPQIVVKKLARTPELSWQKQELGFLKELVHPNIVKYLDRPEDYEENDDTSFSIFMEYCEEGSLRTAITDPTLNYSVLTIIKWSKEIFTALLYLKSKRLAHRDVKPENVFLGRDFVLKVGDFGVSKKFSGEISKYDDHAGTRAYMAPEVKDDNELSETDIYKCDVFGAGLVIWESMERRLPDERLGLYVTFSSNLKDLEKLKRHLNVHRQLVISCSSHSLKIDERSDVEMGLAKLAELEEIFENSLFDPEPERCKSQEVLRQVDGLFPVEVTEMSMMPPFLTGSLYGRNNVSKAPQKSHPLLEIFDTEWMPKIAKKTTFHHLMINKEALADMRRPIHPETPLQSQCMPINWLKFDPHENGETFLNANAMRELFVEEFLRKFQQKHANDDEKVEFMKKANLLQKWVTSGQRFTLIERRSLVFDFLEETLASFARLLMFDFTIQDFSFRFSICLLWHWNAEHLDWFELHKLLQIAIENVEKVDLVFNRKKSFDVCYSQSARDERYYKNDEWLFRKDLSGVEWKEKMQWKSSREVSHMGLEAFRRALYERRGAIKDFANVFAGDITSLPSQVMINVGSLLKRYSNHCPLTRNHFSPIASKITTLEDVFREAESRPVLAEADLESFYQRTDFMQCIFSSNLLLTFTDCFCDVKCSQEALPKNYPIVEAENGFSTCVHLQQRRFLAAHRQFAKALKLLSVWRDLSFYRTTHIHFLKDILSQIEATANSKNGFYFIVVTRSETGKKELFVGGAKHRNILTNDFQLESKPGSLEYVGLVFIDLMDFRELFEAMLDFLEDWRSSAGPKYRDEMQSLINDFWHDHEIYEGSQRKRGAREIFEEQMKIIENYYKAKLAVVKNHPEGKGFEDLLMQNLIESPHAQNLGTTSDFRRSLDNDKLYTELAENLKNTNNLLKDYVFLIDEPPIVQHSKESKLFELMEELHESKIIVISMFLIRQAWLIQELSNLLHGKITDLFLRDSTKRHKTVDKRANSDLQTLLHEFATLKTLRVNVVQLFSNSCLDTPEPEEISLNLAVYWNEKNIEDSWILLSKEEKLFLKIDFSEKAFLEGEFTGKNFRMRGQILKRVVGIGFNYLRFANFDTHLLNDRFGARTISEIPRLFEPFPTSPAYSSYIFQWNVQPLDWPWVIFSTRTQQQLKAFGDCHRNVLKRLQGSKDLLRHSAIDRFWFILENAEAGHREITGLPLSAGKVNVLALNLSDYAECGLQAYPINQNKNMKAVCLTKGTIESLIQLVNQQAPKPSNC